MTTLFTSYSDNFFMANIAEFKNTLCVLIYMGTVNIIARS